MRVKQSLISALLMLGAVAAAQDANTLRGKYRPVHAFEVRPSVLMTAKFADDGQVCELALEKRHSQDKVVSLGSALPDKLIDEVLDEVVPESERGKPNKNLFGLSEISGQSAVTIMDYENVEIRKLLSVSAGCDNGVQVVTVRWTRRRCSAAASSGAKP